MVRCGHPTAGEILFTTNPEDNPLDSEIAVMNRDGTGRARSRPTWASTSVPTGRPMAPRSCYTESNPDDAEILVMNADGSAKLNVSHDAAAEDGFADWGGGGTLRLCAIEQFPAESSRALALKRF